MADNKLEKEQNDLHDAIVNESNEDTKRPLVYPFFRAFFDDVQVESDAENADIYIPGKIVVELKTSDWLAGFYQAQHYLKKGLSFSTICVLANNILALWRLTDESIPIEVRDIVKKSDPHTAPSTIGKKNAKLTSKMMKASILKSAIYKYVPLDDDALFSRNRIIKIAEFRQYLKNLDSQIVRIQINGDNFITQIELMEKFFGGNKMETIHCFYNLVGSWDATSKVSDQGENLTLTSFGKRRSSDPIRIPGNMREEFIKFVEDRFIFTNEGTGLKEDYYFGRFDEVISLVDPEYARLHGIFFTDLNLSRFAIWFVTRYYESELGDKYIVLDPAGGSGNLASTWKIHLRHKIVSELQPDLLKTIERRLKYDPDELKAGFTVIPKTTENKGLNFLDKSAIDYYEQIKSALENDNIPFDKPLAFLLNPPYKNTEENPDNDAAKDWNYALDPAILELAGEDAGNERYLAFLAQILLISRQQVSEHPEFSPLVMIFTPTSWLIPRPVFAHFRKEWDKYFKYEKGFLITSNEFFKVKGRWPLAFTIWRYNYKEKGNKNVIDPRDYTALTRKDLDIDWTASLASFDYQLRPLIKNAKGIDLRDNRGDVRTTLPTILNVRRGIELQQTRYDYSHAKRSEDYGKIVSGFPLNATRLHFELQRTCGSPIGQFVGFYDDLTPVRIAQDSCNRMSNRADRIWFRLDNVFININSTRLLGGAPDKYGFCAYNLGTSIATLDWFALTKAVNGQYPLWANQFNIWPIKVKPELADSFHALTFAFALAENGCVVTTFEANNPQVGAPEIFVDNPLSPINSESFLSTTLAPYIEASPSTMAKALLSSYRNLYKVWGSKFNGKNIMREVGLDEEPYFKYFISKTYKDYVTPHSGIIQIKKYNQAKTSLDLSNAIDDVGLLAKSVKDEIFRMLVDDFKYFE